MTKQYEDGVTRTLELYGSKIGEALTQLRKENPARDWAEVKFDESGISRITFADLKLLEAKVQELTGDPRVKLIRNFEEYKRASYITRGLKPKIAKFEADQDKATLIRQDLIAEQGRIDRMFTENYKLDKNGSLILSKNKEEKQK